MKEKDQEKVSIVSISGDSKNSPLEEEAFGVLPYAQNQDAG